MLGFTLPRAPTSKACSDRKGVCHEQDGSSNLWYDSYWNSLLNSKPFYILFNLGATHSFIFTRSSMQLKLENRKAKTNYRTKLSNNSTAECLISYELISITIGVIIFPKDLIQFDLSNFDIILVMNWSVSYTHLTLPTKRIV